MGRRQAIIADDLSGALEAGAAFHGAGLSVCVPLAAAGIVGEDVALTADVVAVSTESRLCGEAEARRRVRRAVESVERNGGTCVLKKIDSTLRGPIGAELDEVLAWRPEWRLIVASATPAAGRRVREGVLYVNGVPVSESAFGADPVSPVRESDVRRAIEGGFGARTGRLALERVRAGVGVCRDTMLAAFGYGARVVVADAETEGDLDTVVAAGLATGDEVLFVGAGGLAGALARAQGRGRRDGADGVAPDAVERGARLFVCGSGHCVNREQLRALHEAHGVRVVAADAELVERNPERATGHVAKAMADRGAAALVLENVRAQGAGSREDVRRLVDRVGTGLARAVAGIDEAVRVSHVFATGGETARAVCEGLGGRWLRIVGQVEPGVVASEMGCEAGRRVLVTKPGGFGDAETMVRVWRWLRSACADEARGSDG